MGARLKCTCAGPERYTYRTDRREDRELEEFIKKTIPEHDLELFVSELGVNADWSAAYTPNSGPMDAVIKVQLKEHRSKSAQEYVHTFAERRRRRSAFQGQTRLRLRRGGMIRGAMNEGKSTPINIRVTGKNQKAAARSPKRSRRLRQDRRRRRRSHHPAARLSRIRHQRQPRQGRRPGTRPRGRHEKRRRRVQLVDPVQQEELLDRPGRRQSVLRRRAISRGGHQVDRDAAEHPDHEQGPAESDSAEQRDHAPPDAQFRPR